MDLEETKKIIQNKITADEAAREVRSQIKTYIHEKQNAREDFTETFKLLIETSEKAKESIDTQQNKLIEQLQKNQLALTAGFEGNRKAITSGFDKMDEVKKWDSEQLPGYEAIEHPEMEKDEEPEEESEEDEDLNYKISVNDFRFINGEEPDIKDPKGKELLAFSKKYLISVINKGKYDKDKYLVLITNPEERILGVFETRLDRKEPPEEVVRFGDSDLDSGLINACSIKFLEENDLPLPSRIQNESHETVKRYQRRAERLANQFKTNLANKAKFKIRKGKNKAVPLNKNPRTETIQEISYYNILGEYVNNINKLENIARKKEEKGIIHFNNPQQLVDRLELLAGSIIAGNNGVKQEFSQIAHLLHQLKVITKKTLNDLLKKYMNLFAAK